VLTVDPVGGFVSTNLNGYAYPQSFFDTGSNGLYFDNSLSVNGTADVAEPSLTQCTGAAISPVITAPPRPSVFQPAC
jgi:hypothetical protein